MPKQPILLRHSPLSDRIYALTRYRVMGQAVVATEKIDVTDEFHALAGELGYTKPAPTPTLPESDHVE